MEKRQHIFISDTHSKHAEMTKDILAIDDLENSILIHSGDISTRGYSWEVENFLAWFSSFKTYKSIFIAGNHDWIFQENPTEVSNILSKYPEIIYLQNNDIIIDGIKYYGAPQQPTFFNWAFNVDRGEDIKKIWDEIPEDTNVLITHGPPYGFGDEVQKSYYNPEVNVGCKDLLNRINELKELKIVTGGHIHSGHGIRNHNDITIINASLLDEDYKYRYNPIIIEL